MPSTRFTTSRCLTTFFEFDIYDKEAAAFFSLEKRLELLEGTGVVTVPVIHGGPASLEQLRALIGPSAYQSVLENPLTGRPDALMEGIFLRTEEDGLVTGRRKIVRPAFIEKVKQSEYWEQQRMVPDQLCDGVEIWACSGGGNFQLGPW